MTPIVRGRARAAALAVVLAVAALAAGGCGGAEGLISIELVTAPGSTVLDGVTRARLTLSLPYRQVEATRGDDGRFHLELEVPADGPAATVTFEGLDDSGAVLAWGRSGRLPIAAIDADIVIFVAPPESITASPAALDPPRTRMAATPFGFGVVLAGGVDASGTVLDEVAVYDVYRHTMAHAESLPAPRAGMSLVTGVTGYAYGFGGSDAAGTATGTFWRFDSLAEPAGYWRALSTDPTLARTDMEVAPVRLEGFVVTGDPPVVLDGVSLSATPLVQAPPMAGTLTAVQLDDLVYAVAVGEGSGSTGVVRIAPSGVSEDPAPASALRTGHGAASSGDRRVIVAGGAVAGVPTASVIRADPLAGQYTELADQLATARTDVAVAGNGAVVIVAGGRDAGGNVLGDVEVLDAATATRIAVVPLIVPRAEATAEPLASGQILIVGGVDAAGAPIATVEIYTPATPP